MRILVIRIKNLASVQEAEIDFTAEPLASAGIFAITGETGAGKSTILDALCLALYAETPRYASAEGGVYIEDINGNKILQGDIRSILRDGTAEGQAEVEYLGVDGAIYRSTWIVKRAHNKVSGSLQDAKMLLHNVSEHKDISNAKREVLKFNEQYVGLNFQQFTRSVLLAQGDFTAFLKASKDDKASLLEKLTGTEIYTQISAAIHRKHKAASDALLLLRQKTDNIQLLSDEQLEELQKESASLDASLTEGIKERENIQKAIQWYTEFATVEEQLAQAEKEFNVIKAKKDEAIPREHKLQLVDQVEPIRTVFDEVRRIKDALEVKRKTLIAEQAALDEIDLEMLTNTFKSAKISLDQLVDEAERLKPEMDKAKKLDAEIQLQHDFVVLAHKAKEKAQQELNDVTSKKNNKKKALDQLKIENEKIEQWLEAVESKKQIAIHVHFILSKLQEAEESLHIFKDASSILAEKQNELNAVNIQLDALQAEHASSLNLYKLEERAVVDLEKALQEKPITQWRKQLIEHQEQKTTLLLVIGQWETYIKILEAESSLLERISQKEKKIESTKNDLVAISDSISIKKPVVDNAKEVFDKAKLAVSENIEKLRGLLVDGEECVVCGSREHPYASHLPTDFGLKTIEENYNALTAELKDLETNKTQLEQILISDAQQLKQLGLERDEKKLSKEEAYAKLMGYSIFNEYAAVHHDKIADYLIAKQKDVDENINKIKENIDHCTIEGQELENKKLRLNERREKNDERKASIHELTLTQTSISGQINNENLRFQSAANVLAQCKITLGTYFDSDNWYVHWEADPKKQLQAIKQFAENWTATSKSYEEGKQDLGLLNVEINGLTELIDTAIKDHQAKLEAYDQANSKLTDLQTTRSAMFEGKAIQDVEQELAVRIREKKSQVTIHEDALAAATNKAIEYRTKANSLKEEINVLTIDLDKQHSKMNDWLLSFNKDKSSCFDLGMLEELMRLDRQWIRNERSTLHELAQAFVRAEGLLHQRKSDRDICLQRRVVEDPLESLRAKLEVVESTIKQIEKRIIEIGLLQKTDDENRKVRGSYASEIEKQEGVVNDLARLNELIGASDGKKFKLLAQEYTLDLLLGYANVHLKKLSQRYVLQRIAGTLGLQVVDRDMGDEIRPIFSVSGGESFLISLALALGLASLSSNKMNVESLFIDEGFGTLDPLTLSIAMDALERLQSEGRKVGVISHVQEMTERIPVQIKVSKLQHGRSSIKVSQFALS